MRRRTRFAFLLSLMATILARPAGAACQNVDDDRVGQELLTELAPGAAIGTIAARYGLTVIDGIPAWNLWDLEAGATQNVDAIVTQMSSDPDITEVEPHRLIDTPEGIQLSIPDLDFSATSTTFHNQPSALAIHTTAAHASYAGSGVTIAVLDTGMAFDHPETGSAILAPGIDCAGGDGTAGIQGNGLDDDGDGLIDESIDHATHIAGVLNLVAPGARILPIRVLEEDGKGKIFDIARGILTAIQNGADVINLSFGMARDSRVIERALDAADAAGIVVVSGAGNRSLDCVEFPASDQRVIAVAAVDPSFVRTGFSNYGSEVALSAPGLSVLSTFAPDLWARWGGTSFATPMVTGAAAVLLGKYPGLTPAQIRGVLTATTQPDANPPELAGLMGTGVLDLSAVAAALTSDRTSLKVSTSPAGATLRWSPVQGATNYDVVRGDVAHLAIAGGSVQLGTVQCVINDSTVSNTDTLPDAANPGPGQTFFYLFRDNAPGQTAGSYGTDPQGRPRFPSGGDCPLAR